MTDPGAAKPSFPTSQETGSQSRLPAKRPGARLARSAPGPPAQLVRVNGMSLTRSLRDPGCCRAGEPGCAASLPSAAEA